MWGRWGLVEEGVGKMTDNRRKRRSRMEVVKGLEGHGVRRQEERVTEGGER